MALDAALREVARSIDSEHHRRNLWNVHPLICLCAPPDVVNLNLPHELWQSHDGNPAAMLRTLSTGALMPDGLALPPVTGVVVTFEVWSFGDADTTAQDLTPEQLEVYRAGMIHLHPDRVSVRQTLAVAPGGDIMLLTRQQASPTGAQNFGTLRDAAKIPSLLAVVEGCMQFMQNLSPGAPATTLDVNQRG